MKEHWSWMEKTFSFCFIKLCVACSLFPLLFLLLVFYLLCATLEWPQNMEANEKAGIGWVLICQRGVHFRGSAKSWRSHLPPCEIVSKLLSLCWWVILPTCLQRQMKNDTTHKKGPTCQNIFIVPLFNRQPSSSCCLSPCSVFLHIQLFQH